MTLSVEMQPRDGSWIKLGDQQTGGYGVVPDSIEFDGDLAEYGCLSATFRLKLNPRWPRDIIEHFTPVVISQGSEHRFSGRVIAAPTTFADDAEVVVQCQGWGQHLKDDCTDREWVVNDLSRWVDTTSLPATNPAFYTIGSTIESSNGALMAKFGQGTVVKSNRGCCSFTLDLGANNTAKRFVMNAENFGFNAGTVFLYVRSSTAPDGVAGGTFSDAYSAATPAAAATNYSGTFAIGYRYVHVFLYYTGADTTLGQEQFFRVNSMSIFTDAADESGGASILKASTIIGETLDAVAPLISSDRSKIQATSTSIPNFPGSPGYRYGNELIDAANSIHGYLARLSPDPTPVFEYGPLPTDYNFMVGAGDYKLSEPAAQDGRSVFNRVITEFEDAAGVRAESSVATTLERIPSQIANYGFDVDTSGWRVAGNDPNFGSVARSTAIKDTGAGSGQLVGGLTGKALINYGVSSLGATDLVKLQGGTKYTARFRIYRAAAITEIAGNMPIAIYNDANPSIAFAINDSTDSTAAVAAINAIPLNTWTTVDVPFTTRVETSTFAVLFQLGIGSGVTAMYVDNVEILQASSNVLGRRGTRRTALKPMENPSNATIATSIAQLKLDNSQYPPFRGTITVTGRIRTKGGGSMHVSCLPSCVGDALLVENLTDPNTGALGRQGIIRTAKYTEATDTAEITIDDPTGFLDIIVNRLSAATRL